MIIKKFLRGLAEEQMNPPKSCFMESSMKNPILRILVFIILFSIISGMVVLIIGYLQEWKTPIQFSDGFFWAGLILISLGFISFQGYRQHVGVWPPPRLNPSESANLLNADILRGRNIMVFLGVCGLLMFCLSFLILKLL
jgi:hypothetical protein